MRTTSLRKALAIVFAMSAVMATGAFGASRNITIALTADPGTADVQKTTDSYCIPLNIYDRLVSRLRLVRARPQENRRDWRLHDAVLDGQ